MKQFDPLPLGETEKWIRRLGGKSLEEIVCILGSPSREIGPSEWMGHSPGQRVEVIHHSRSLEFTLANSPIKTLLIHVCDDGRFDYEFRGRELPDSNSITTDR